jgi:hypothetical protein
MENLEKKSLPMYTLTTNICLMVKAVRSFGLIKKPTRVEKIYTNGIAEGCFLLVQTEVYSRDYRQKKRG